MEPSKIRKRFVAVLLWTVFWVTPSMAVYLPAQQVARGAEVCNRCQALALLSLARVVQGRFTQEKHLPVLKRPLKASGFFMAVREHGILWEVDAPIGLRMVLTTDVLRQYSDAGVLELQTTETAYFGVGGILPALFNGDMALLSGYFAIHYYCNAQQWELVLEPTTEKLARLLKSVVIKGDSEHISQTSLYGRFGDITHIRFQMDTVSRQAATAEQLAWFM